MGAGGFIGHHMTTHLKQNNNNYVIGVDLHYPKFASTQADEFFLLDLTSELEINRLPTKVDEIYQFAANMGGAGYIFTGANDFDILSDNSRINSNVIRYAKLTQVKKLFFSSSACVYPKHNQLDAKNPICSESSAYPADPDSEYGWEKLFSERLYLSLAKHTNTVVKIARYHNVYGPLSEYNSVRSKAPAALCNKIINNNTEIEIWGDGNQTRSFLYIDDCIAATEKLMQSDLDFPVNIGSEYMVTINQLVDILIGISHKNLKKTHVQGPVGVTGRCSDNTIMAASTGWSPSVDLALGLEKTYKWVQSQYVR